MPDDGRSNLRPTRFGHHDNTFGFLRLLFASLVIVSHTPEIYDGNRSREMLTLLFGTISFGDLAVDGFFIISGYLITGSYLNSSSSASYALKRIVRIYPAFIVASLVCLFLVTPIAGGSLDVSPASWAFAFTQMIGLQPAELGVVFPSTYYAALNGPMWTISYEFKCYVLILLLGMAGILSRRWIVLVMTIGLLALSIISPIEYVPAHIEATSVAAKDFSAVDYLRGIIFGNKSQTFRLFSVFMVGSSYYLFRDKLRFGWPFVALATIGLCVSLSISYATHAGVAVFGGILVLAAAKGANGGLLEKVNNESDISYGVYLYAWPITKLLFWWWPTAPIVLVGLMTLVLACACGWLSWMFVEAPAMRRLRRR